MTTIKVDLSNVWPTGPTNTQVKKSKIQDFFVKTEKSLNLNNIETMMEKEEEKEEDTTESDNQNRKAKKLGKTTNVLNNIETMMEKEEEKDTTESVQPNKKTKKLLNISHDEKNYYEIGIDEAGRGPLFGRLYIASVVLPKDGSMDISLIKDSKTFTSRAKILSVYNYIKAHAIAYHVHYIESEVIDKINIRQAVLQGMRECAKQTMAKLDTKPYDNTTYKNKYFLMIDGDDFKPYTAFNEQTNSIEVIPHETFIGGDNTYAAIAAASILAKVERDNYILELCNQYPVLVERYKMNDHKGYGTKVHLTAIQTYGITQFHRKTFGSCKTAKVNTI
jgi:ribonuclease HII